MEKRDKLIEKMDDKKVGLFITLITWIISGTLYFITTVAIVVIYVHMGWEDSMHYPLLFLLFTLVCNVIMYFFIYFSRKNKSGGLDE